MSDTSTDTFQAAIVGAGRVADRHAHSLAADPRAAVRAVCDTDFDRAARVADPYNAAVYTDYERLFEGESIDVCYLLTPPFVRAGPAVAAAERGIDLFCEKPAAVCLDDAREVLRAIEANDVVTHSGYDLRYAKTVEAARDLLADRQIGLVDARHWAGLPREGWKSRRETAGSYPIHIATHAYDLVRYFAGEVERVAAVGSNRIAGDRLEYDDVGSVSLSHSNGTVSHVSHVAFRNVENTLDLVGEDFHLRIHRNDNTLQGEIDGEPVCVRGAAEFAERERWGTMTETFLDSVETRDTGTTRSDYADATRTLELTVATTEAMRAGGTAELRRRD